MKEYSGNSLTTSVVKLLLKGNSFNQIAENLEVKVDKVIEVWQEYCRDRYSIPFEEPYSSEWVNSSARLALA